MSNSFDCIKYYKEHKKECEAYCSNLQRECNWEPNKILESCKLLNQNKNKGGNKVALKWIVRKTNYWRGSFTGFYLTNAKGEVLARVRGGLDGHGEGATRTYSPPTTLARAMDSESNYTNRYNFSHSVTEEKRALMNKYNKGGRVAKTAKKVTRKTNRIVKARGPYGSIRFRDVKTGQFVSA